MAKANTNFDARHVAIYVLQHTNINNTLQSSLDFALSKFKLSDKDSALCTELVYGYTRHALRINFVLDKLLPNRPALPQVLQLTLGISVYAILFLERIPHYATVDFAVNYTKVKFGLGLSKLCNGVLRSLLRLEDAPLHEEFYDNVYEYYSIPQWIYELWLNAYGEDITQKLLIRSKQKPKTALRLNPLHTDYFALKEFFSSLSSAQGVGFDGFVFVEGAAPKIALNKTLSELHMDGAFSWQAAGSQELLKLCFDAVPSLRKQIWFDACAGQGGKTFAMLEQGIDVFMVSDVSKSRLAQLQVTANRLSILKPHLLLMSGSSPALNSFSGSILLDVPCSGLGTLARRPDICINRTAKDVKIMQKLQYNILNKSFELLGTKSYLIYMTCTLNPAENENQIDKFLKKNANAAEVFTSQTPHDHPWLEGMFVSVLQKI